MGTKAQAASKEVRELIRKVKAQGCEVELMGSGHHRISRPGTGPTVTISGTGVAYNTWQRTLKLLRLLLAVEV